MGNRQLALTIIIIAGNEQEMITDCLKSALFVKNIILVAANSSDSTVNIAKKIYPAIKIITVNDEYGKNFAKWHNIGLKNANTEWIYYLDADERITTKLAKEIVDTIKFPKNNYYVNPRQNYYLGKLVKHGGAYPDYVKRLFKRSDLKEWTGILHEEPHITGPLGYLKNPLIHYTHRDLSSMIQKTLIWTEMEALALYKTNHPPVVWWRILRMMFTTFVHRFIMQQMWKDGTVGIISVFYESFDTFIIYSRLWELQQNDKNSRHL